MLYIHYSFYLQMFYCVHVTHHGAVIPKYGIHMKCMVCHNISANERRI
jgi:hypothetical protein